MTKSTEQEYKPCTNLLGIQKSENKKEDGHTKANNHNQNYLVGPVPIDP